MKIDEFKKIEEFRLSDLFGDYGSGLMKSKLSGKDAGAHMNQDMFIKDFTDDASTALDSAIKGGLIDPGAKAPTGPGADAKTVDPGTVKPEPGAPGASPGTVTPGPETGAAAPAAGAAGAAGKALSPGTHMATGDYKKQQQTTQNLNSYVQGISKQIAAAPDKAQKIALTKEIVNYMADRKDAPEWDNALKTVELVVKKNAGDPNFANKAISALRAGQPLDLNPAGSASPEQVRQQQSAKDKANRAKGPMMKGQMKRGAAPAGAVPQSKKGPALRAVKEAWKIYYLNKLVEGAGLTWKDLGLTVLKESKTRTFKIIDTKYLRLNHIFESIVEDAGAGNTISYYLKNMWYPKYMKNVDYKSQEPAIDKHIANVEASYAKDGGMAALTQLANLSFALSRGKAVPAGAADITKDAGAKDAGAKDATGAQAAGAQTGAQAAGAQTGAQAAGAQASVAPNIMSQLGKMNSNQLAELSKNILARLKEVDAKLYSDTMKEISSGAAPAKPSIADRPATPAAADKVAESELKRLKSLKNKILKK